MTAEITFFPVGNGDMTLIKLASGRTILIDCNIREPGDGIPDVAPSLRDQLQQDAAGRTYVDVFLLSHPDQDHCRGLRQHFHLGAPVSRIPADRILIREIWSSPLVLRRASKDHVLCDDAAAFNSEAKRRVALLRTNSNASDGDRIVILGHDESGKTDDIRHAVVEVGSEVPRICGQVDPSVSARLLAPLRATDAAEEELLTKNNSSVVMNIGVEGEGVRNACHLLSGGDAGVAVWERLWRRHSAAGFLQYHVLQTPHHCSWHSLSYDSWSELRERAKVSPDARSALSQALPGAFLVASSCPIVDNDNDPPCIRAKREYERIAEGVNGEFKCTGEYPTTVAPQPLVFEVTRNGPRRRRATTDRGGSVGRVPLPHG